MCDVRYKEMTKDGLLRQSVFLRFRDDKKAEDVVMPGEKGDGRRNKDDAVPQRTSPRPPLPREVKFSNLDKVFWPEEKYTKGDLIEYYRSMAPWLLPYLKERPLVLTRYPDGINGKSFYQKDAPGFVPDWIQTIPIWSEDTQRDIQYFVANDVETLVYLVNLGTIPLPHRSGSERGALRACDHAGEDHARAVRAGRDAGCHQDDGKVGAAYHAPARPPDELRPIPSVRDVVRSAGDGSPP